jgi:hypothetical protein
MKTKRTPMKEETSTTQNKEVNAKSEKEAMNSAQSPWTSQRSKKTKDLYLSEMKKEL